MDCSMQGLPVPHYLLEFAQVPVHWIGNAINHLILFHPLFFFWAFKYLLLLFCDPWMIWKVLLFSKCMRISCYTFTIDFSSEGLWAEGTGVDYTISPPTVSRDHLVVPLPFLCDWCSFSTVLWSFLHPVFSVFMVASLEWVSSYLSCFGVNVLPEDKVLCLLGILEIFQPFFCWLLLQSNLCLTFSHHFPSLILLLIFVF